MESESYAQSSDSSRKRNSPEFIGDLLSIRVKLDNGTYGNAYAYIPGEDDDVIRCNVCDVSIQGSARTHNYGRRHQSRMGMSQHAAEKFNVQHQPKQTILDVNFEPGEPLPPGYEDETKSVTEIQDKLDSFRSSPLIGLEYLVELIPYEDGREPGYVCLLCDKRGDPRTVMAHLVSYNHRLTYLQSHFPTAYRSLGPYQTKQYRKALQDVVLSICSAVEKKYGRLKPHSAEQSTFEGKKSKYLDVIINDVHFSERTGDNFMHLVDREVILSSSINPTFMELSVLRGHQNARKSPSPPNVLNPAKKGKIYPGRERDKDKDRDNKAKALSPLSSISSSSMSKSLSRSRSRSRSGGRQERRNRRRSRSRSPRRRYRRTRSRSPAQRYRREREVNYRSMPWEKSNYVSRSSREESVAVRRERKMLDFRKQALILEEDMENEYLQHEKNPEKHPAYTDEWKKFWNRRYKEIQAENKDPSKHDFKPEWINFWNVRMRELHNLELKSRKEALRKRMNIPEEPTPISFRIGDKKKNNLGQAVTSVDPEVIVIDDGKDDDVQIVRKRSRSPWSTSMSDKDKNWDLEEPLTKRRPSPELKPKLLEDDYVNSKRRERDLAFYRPSLFGSYGNSSRDYVAAALDSDGQINVVAVLRHLTALEEKLGSLGPKIIELLSQALALEKAEGNSSESLLDSETNCVLFETVKEKLKGQLLAGLVEYAAEKAFKNAIQSIANLLHFAAERKKELEIKKKAQPLQLPGVGSVDKAVIAKQIASALVAQGKTDVTQGELEELINAVVGMAQASQGTGKTVTAADFARQISSGKPTGGGQSLADKMSQQIKEETMENFSDAELKTLLQNFKNLSTDEQHRLIAYLKKLETREPERVEKLRRFVNLDGAEEPVSPVEEAENVVKDSPKNSPRLQTVKIDSDEEEYTFEDVFKAASETLREKQLEEERKLMEEAKLKTTPLDLTDAKMIIASLMGQFSGKKPENNLLGLPVQKEPPISPPQTGSITDNLLQRGTSLRPMSQLLDSRFAQGMNPEQSSSGMPMHQTVQSSYSPMENIIPKILDVPQTQGIVPHANPINPSLSMNPSHSTNPASANVQYPYPYQSYGTETNYSYNQSNYFPNQQQNVGYGAPVGYQDNPNAYRPPENDYRQMRPDIRMPDPNQYNRFY